MSKVLPEHFGKYILMRKIALGGMAEIFKAKTAGAEGFEKELVIKRILPHFTEDESFVKMFIDEASITAKLQHPNIVQIFDFDVAEGTYYIAMEYIEGRDLKDVLEESIRQQDALSVAQCVWIIMEVSKGLHYAHTKDYKGKPLNIVHRDVSPSNAMVAYNGEIKLMDFGIAKAAQRSTKTMAGAVKGKVAYMSPEQARGKPLDGRSDLFALSVMLWEMLTGRRLFLAESDFETLTNVLKADAPPPSQLNPDVPSDLDPIILKALEKKREDRYESVEAFGRELTRWYYSNVIDLEKEKLRPLMYRLFSGDIAAVRRANDAERVAEGGGESAEMLNSESTAMLPAMEDINMNAEKTVMDMGAMKLPVRAVAPSSEAATRAMPAAEMLEELQTTKNDEKTRMDQSAYDGDDVPIRPPRAKGKGKKGTYSHLLAADEKKKSKLPLIIAAILLLAGAAVALILLLGDDTTKKPPVTTTTEGVVVETIQAVETASVTVEATPALATVTVDGKPATAALDVPLNTTVTVVAQAEGYTSQTLKVLVDQPDQTIEIALEKKPETTNVVIKPADKNAAVFINGKRLGVGVKTYTCEVGTEFTIKVESSSGGPPTTKVVACKSEMDVVTISSPAKLAVSVDPPDATLKPSAGMATQTTPGVFTITDLQIGDQLTVTVDAPKHKSVSRTVTLEKPFESVTVVLEKQATVAAVANGTIQAAAKPWADVYINGRKRGTSPVTVSVPPGTYSVKFQQGTKKVKTQRVQVRSGKVTYVKVTM
ncbi:MAG: tRNA A-37 threonylcarbamoyl transferase component Bud32 [Myxococcota bacterium]|jgi:tRNA A-37 threonylcarbamoyl transferase component Bud32